MQWSLPDTRYGFMISTAVDEPPSAASLPEPELEVMMVWISSMKRIRLGSWMMNSSIDLSLSSNMPLSSHPASAPEMSAS